MLVASFSGISRHFISACWQVSSSECILLAVVLQEGVTGERGYFSCAIELCPILCAPINAVRFDLGCTKIRLAVSGSGVTEIGA